MLAVIDYGAGNLQSVINALTYLGIQNKIARNVNEIEEATALILPGVGAFGAAMQELNNRGLTECIKKATLSKPFLGICLGMQLLFETSEETEGCPGLGILQGTVKKFPKTAGLKIPHMGWNSLSKSEKSLLFSGMPQNSYVYFVHSYYCKANDRNVVAATCDYGVKFDAAVEKGKLFGCQFHPEKSGSTGLEILRKFASLLGGAE